MTAAAAAAKRREEASKTQKELQVTLKRPFPGDALRLGPPPTGKTLVPRSWPPGLVLPVGGPSGSLLEATRSFLEASRARQIAKILNLKGLGFVCCHLPGKG